MQDCIEWKGAKSTRGYGNILIKGKNYKAHRIAYKNHYGDFDEKLLVCHKCDNPSCVNPLHLFLGTHKDNSKDMVNKGRNKHGDTSGEKNGQHKLSYRSIKIIRQFLYQKIPGFEIATAYGISKAQVSRIKNNKKWRIAA